jgi:hypothetical protein
LCHFKTSLSPNLKKCLPKLESLLSCL